MIRILCTVFLAGVVLPLSAVSETDRELAVRRQRVTAIREQAEALRSLQPDFADWVKHQEKIYDSFEKALRYDRKYAPERAHWILADYDFLLTMMEQEVKYFKTQPDPASTGSISVLEFGAQGDGVTDDAPAFRKAFAAAAAGPKRQVRIPAGRYLLSPEEGVKPVFTLRGVRDVEITGEPGTVLELSTPRPTIFLLEDCENVRLRNFHVTASYQPFTTGIVKEVRNPDTLLVEMDPGMIAPTHPIFRECQSKGLVRFASQELRSDGKTPRALSIAAHYREPEVEHIDGNLYRFRFPKTEAAEKEYRPGMRMIYYARDYGNHKFSNIGSDHTRISGVSIDTSSAMAFLSRESNVFFLTDCTVKAKGHTFVATAADGVYLYNSILGGYIARNDIGDLGDDYLNVHTQIRRITRRNGRYIYLPIGIAKGLFDRMTRVGLIRRSRGDAFISAEYEIKNKSIVTHFENGKPVKRLKLELAEELPDLVTSENRQAEGKAEPDYLAFPELQLHGLVVAENRFSRGVSRILPGGRNWLLADNEIDDPLGWILFTMIESWIGHPDETFFPRNITISGNRFHSLHKSIFTFGGGFSSGQPETFPAHFFINNNRFSVESYGDNTLPLFLIRGVDHMVFTDNEIHIPATRGELFMIEESRGVVTTPNRITR